MLDVLLPPLVTATGGAAVVAALFTVGSYLLRDRGKDKSDESRQLRDLILNRIVHGVPVSRSDVSRFASARGLSSSEAHDAVERLYSEELSDVITAEVLQTVGSLLGELEMQQPYETLPAEVRQSLVRLNKLVRAETRDEEDRQVLTPIVSTLTNYAGLEKQKRRQAAHVIAAYVIGVASVILGGTALLYTPSPAELANHIVDALQIASRSDE
ncbi:MAG: hypothetical protein OXG82_00195 [Gammaproteobacteria bacterium]|nr:hypothetical protein [Gammaproteobacteria bacterium]